VSLGKKWRFGTLAVKPPRLCRLNLHEKDGFLQEKQICQIDSPFVKCGCGV